MSSSSLSHFSSSRLSFVVFGSGFAETSDSTAAVGADTQSDVDDAASDTASFSSFKWTRHFEDSDDEDDEMLADSPDDPIFETDSSSQTAQPSGGLTSEDSVASLPSLFKDTTEKDSATVGSDTEAESRNVRPKLSHPSSPRNTGIGFNSQEPEWQHVAKSDPIPGPNKTRVVVKDVAYTTYRAVLYYVSSPFTHIYIIHPKLICICVSRSTLTSSSLPLFLPPSIHRHRKM